jgi:hypothetical protein
VVPIMIPDARFAWGIVYLVSQEEDLLGVERFLANHVASHHPFT